jgi:hypothetical protein
MGERGLPSYRDQPRPTDQQKLEALVRYLVEDRMRVLDHNNWAIQFRGWVQPTNQIIDIGVIYATHEKRQGFVASVIGGEITATNDPMGTIDLTPRPGETFVFRTPRERLMKAVEAYKDLIATLDRIDAETISMKGRK